MLWGPTREGSCRAARTASRRRSRRPRSWRARRASPTWSGDAAHNEAPALVEVQRDRPEVQTVRGRLLKQDVAARAGHFFVTFTIHALPEAEPGVAVGRTGGTCRMSNSGSLRARHANSHAARDRLAARANGGSRASEILTRACDGRNSAQELCAAGPIFCPMARKLQFCPWTGAVKGAEVRSTARKQWLARRGCDRTSRLCQRVSKMSVHGAGPHSLP